jgi:tetratricopeptide (TPR) repeat protein
MVRNIVILCFILMLTSCEKINELSSIIIGNQQVKNGDYQGAVVSYLKGIDSENYREYYFYNLGNIYSYLGEYPSAFFVWEKAKEVTNPVMQYNLLYNKGVLEYQKGKYKEAYLEFKKALVINPNKIEAKINLELSLQKMNVANYSSVVAPVRATGQSGSISDETTRILEYVIKKEEMVWIKAQKQTDSVKDW